MEYGMIVTNVDFKPAIETAPGKDIAQNLTVVLQQVVQTTSKAIDKLEGGGWHIISHELTKLGNTLLVSFLIRR
jgi:hypothetical protein